MPPVPTHTGDQSQGADCPRARCLLTRAIRLGRLSLCLALCLLGGAGCGEREPVVRYGTLVRFEGPPAPERGAVVRLLVLDLEGADTTGWRSAAGTVSPYEQLRALGLAMQRYKADTVVVRHLPTEAEVGGAASAAELLAAASELYYRAERDEASELCVGRDWDERWWPRRCRRQTLIASRRPVVVRGAVVELGASDGAVQVGLEEPALAGMGLDAAGELRLAPEQWRLLRSATDQLGGLLLRPARFYELQRVAPPAEPR